MAVTANQFQLTPNVGSDIKQGLNIGNQFRQQQLQPEIDRLNRESVLGQQALTQQKLVNEQEKQKQLTTQNRVRSVVEAAVQAKNLPNDDSKIRFLKKRRSDLIAQDPNANTEDTDEVISAFESGDSEAANNLINSAVDTGLQLGMVKPPSFEAEKVRIRGVEADLRKEEAKERAIDRELKRATNTVKKTRITNQVRR